MPERVIEIRGLRKSYGAVEAVDGIDLHVDRGEVFALLGPNGAGKTTTTEILEGFRTRDEGEVSVLGVDPAENIAAAPLPPRGFRRLVQEGEIYGGRHPGAILDAIERLIAGGAIAPGSVRLSLIGPSTDAAIPNLDVLRRLEGIGAVEYVPSLVPRAEACRVASGAPWRPVY